MKRLFISLSLLAGFIFTQAQDAAVPTLNYSSLEKKLAKNDEAIQDEKANVKPKTWFTRGELLQDINDVNIEFLRLGMGTMETKIYLKDPIEIKPGEKEGVVQELYVYERITLTFENDMLVDWEETQVIHENPLPEALKAYKMTLELDVDKKLDIKVHENLERLKRQFESKAIQAYNRGDYAGAVEVFEYIVEVSDTRVYEGYADTIIIYNTALAARNAGMHEKSAEYFRKSIDIGYGGSDAYYLLKEEYAALKDSNKIIATLEEGFQKYPDTTLLLIEIVNFYLVSGNAEEGLKYLTLTEQREATNPSVYFAKGTLYEKVGEKEKALEAYNKAIEIDPEYFNAYFNIGALYYNNAVEMYDIANAKEDLKEYNEAKALADEELMKAKEPMEKAHEINPKERSVLETLQTIYYRLQMTDKYEEVKQKISEL